MAPIVYIVHCIDTEGPLRETLDQTFERLNAIFGLSLDPSPETLAKIQRGEMDLGGVEEAAAAVVRPDLLAYNDGWDKVDAMLDRIATPAYREKFADDDGRGWVYNWFCCDHVGHTENPRARAEGLHVVHDYYQSRFGDESGDSIQFHFHPEALNRRANSNATHWFANTSKLFDILSARILERNWFPSVNRPGFHTERPDSHWFLEQFIPFDYANQALRRGDGDEQPDVASGRFGDWRRAPSSWLPYRPSHDDYQTRGDCRRHIFRCLNVGTRFRCLTLEDVQDAMIEAERDGVAVLAFTNHDFRDMGKDVEHVWELIGKARKNHPDIRIVHADARQAAQASIGLTNPQSPAFNLSFEDGRLHVESKAPIFGPQPYLAIASRDGSRFHDAMDIHKPFRRWSYTLDDQTLPVEAVSAIGVAAAAPCGSVTVTVENLLTGQSRTTLC